MTQNVDSILWNFGRAGTTAARSSAPCRSHTASAA